MTPPLAQLFPFFVRIGAADTITEVGPSLAKLAAGLVGRSFEDVFTASSRGPNHAVVLSLKSRNVTLRGQFIDWSGLTFIGSPQLAMHEGLAPLALSELGLAPGDFAPHDALPEMTTLLAVADAQVKGLTDLASELEARGAMLSAANVEAEAARGEAVLASKVKSRFLAVMTHELRTPLNAIIGLTQLMLESQVTADQRELLKVVDGASQTLLSLVGDILDFSKIEAGRVELDRRPFSTQGLIAMVTALVRQRASERQLRFDVIVSPNVPPGVEGDELRLKQVLLNLLGNAVKFTPPQGLVQLDVGYADGKLSFSVSDTGIGIAPETLGRIFEPFTQADSSTTRSFGGTGLGLAISQQLVEAMGGTLAVTSNVGAGAHFSFTIPAAATLPPQTDTPPPTLERVPPLRVLVAEDSAINALVVRRVLAAEGHSVTVVEDGLQAVEAAQRDTYDVILMDMQMPILDGAEATRRLRTNGYTRPIVGLTANATTEDIHACREAGMNEVLLKPLEVGRLRALLMKVATQRLAPSVTSKLHGG